jgi:hypothetical protein
MLSEGEKLDLYRRVRVARTSAAQARARNRIARDYAARAVAVADALRARADDRAVARRAQGSGVSDSK